MAEQFGNFTISNNNGSPKSGQRPSVIVRNASGQIHARLHSDKGRLLQRMRRNLLSEERATLIAQMKQTGVPDDVIAAMLSLKGK